MIDGRLEEKLNRYRKILGYVFFQHFSTGDEIVHFERSELEACAHDIGVKPPKNLGDIIYSARYRGGMPEEVSVTASRGRTWIILPNGRGHYAFVQSTLAEITPRVGMVETKIQDSTPGVIVNYVLSDEQALLAKIRYNRLIDVFSGATCYSLQSHLRTTVKYIGHVETDEVCVGLNKLGKQFVFPIQAKGGVDVLHAVQVWQDLRMCSDKRRLAPLLCRPIAAQFGTGADQNLIVLFELAETDEVIRISENNDYRGIRVVEERHYRLVPPEDVDEALLRGYNRRADPQLDRKP